MVLAVGSGPCGLFLRLAAGSFWVGVVSVAGIRVVSVFPVVLSFRGGVVAVGRDEVDVS